MNSLNFSKNDWSCKAALSGKTTGLAANLRKRVMSLPLLLITAGYLPDLGRTVTQSAMSVVLNLGAYIAVAFGVTESKRCGKEINVLIDPHRFTAPSALPVSVKLRGCRGLMVPIQG